MKISVVFIVILLVLMALIPNSLTEDQPLRFRVQQWLSYGLGFSYAVLALLTLFLSVATVAFEQRDKIIWQTATKPVASWQYVLGKWSGVMVLNLVLLSVSAGGVYIFTEFLTPFGEIIANRNIINNGVVYTDELANINCHQIACSGVIILPCVSTLTIF